jgi:hypothetical protein
LLIENGAAAKNPLLYTANSPAVPPEAAVSERRFEFASILDTGGAAETSRSANSTAFAACYQQIGATRLI